MFRDGRDWSLGVVNCDACSRWQDVSTAPRLYHLTQSIGEQRIIDLSNESWKLFERHNVKIVALETIKNPTVPNLMIHDRSTTRLIFQYTNSTIAKFLDSTSPLSFESTLDLT